MLIMKKMINSHPSMANGIASLYPTPIPLLKLANDEGRSVIYDKYGKNTCDGMTW